MNQQQINISEMSVEALKALAYDQLVMINRCQAAIQALETELAKRAEAVVPPPDKPEQ